MPSIIDLPIRESAHQNGGTYTADVVIAWPNFSYWVKAGMAFTLGAGIITVTAAVCWLILSWSLLLGVARALTH